MDSKLKNSTRLMDFLSLSPIIPVLFLLIMDPKSLMMAWNEGRGGLIFAAIFLLIEWMSVRGSLTFRLDRKRILIFSSSFFGISFFYALVYLWNFHERIASTANILGIPGTLNWIWLWEYIVYAIFLILCLISLFGKKGLREFIVPIVYLFGTAAILLLDALFPYNSLSFMAWFIPIIMGAVVFLLWISGIQVLKDFPMGNPPYVYVSQNLLFVKGNHGSIVLEINWPCIGVLSMLIYALLITIIMIKLNAPLRRKIFYASIGAVGTFFVNVFRVYLITWYTLFISVDVKIFHESIGEALFLAWIVAFLLIVMKVEMTILKSSSSPKEGPVSELPL
ncbi:MAG: exosortase/archaeosortase family protein [Candidatus Bathyarchaeia archaeon]